MRKEFFTTRADRRVPTETEKEGLEISIIDWLTHIESSKPRSNGSTYATDEDNRLASDGTYTYEYDREGNRVKRTEIATGETTEYKWDHRNRLVRVVDKNASGIPTQAVDHAYDAENQWIRRTVDPDGDTGSVPVERTVFVHDDDQIVMQFDDTGSADLTKDDLSHRYLWGAAVDQLRRRDLYNHKTNRRSLQYNFEKTHRD